MNAAMRQTTVDVIADIRLFDLWWMITGRHAGHWEEWVAVQMEGDPAEVWAALTSALNGNVSALKESRNPYSCDEFIRDVEVFLERRSPSNR